jgi:hypothetical protein
MGLLLGMKFLYLLQRMPKGFYVAVGIAVGINIDDLYPIFDAAIDFCLKKTSDIIMMMTV